MSIVVMGLALLLALSLIRRSFRLTLGLGGGLLAAVVGLQGGGTASHAPRNSPLAPPRPWVIAPGVERLWVATDALHRRTCPSTDCGSVGRLALGAAVSVREQRDGWVRVTEPYDARCTEGQSALVASGEPGCTEANGIVAGQVAEWVSATFLVPTPPASAPVSR